MPRRPPANARELRARRKQHRKYMKAWRKKHRETGRDKELLKLERARCTERENIMKFVRNNPERPDCWIWEGPWMHSSFGRRAKPRIKLGASAWMFADKAVWTMEGREPVKKGQYLKARCGYADCVSPACLYATNAVLERARKSLALSQQADDPLPSPAHQESFPRTP